MERVRRAHRYLVYAILLQIPLSAFSRRGYYLGGITFIYFAWRGLKEDGELPRILEGLRRPSWQGILAGVVAALLLFPLGMFTNGLIFTYIFKGASQMNQALWASESDTPLWLSLLSTALIAPFGEELFFRGYLLRVYERHGKKNAILLSALLFALVHLFPAAFLDFGIMAIVAATLVYRYGSIYPAMAMHAVHNGLGTLLHEFARDKLNVAVDRNTLLLFLLLLSIPGIYVLGRWVRAALGGENPQDAEEPGGMKVILTSGVLITLYVLNVIMGVALLTGNLGGS